MTVGDKRFCSECEKESAESKHRMWCSQEPRFTEQEEREREDQHAEQQAQAALHPKCGLCEQGVPIVLCTNHDLPEHIIDLKGAYQGPMCHHPTPCDPTCRKPLKRVAVICIGSEYFKRARA